MKSNSSQQQAAKYLVKAEELRSIAIQAAEDRNRAVLLRAADAYEQMAHWTPRRFLQTARPGYVIE